MGAWLAGCILILIANQNAPIVERLVRSPSMEAAKTMVKLEQTEGRMLLRHFAAQVDRRLRSTWERVEIGLGLAVLLSLFLGSGGKRYPGLLCLLMLGCVCFLHWFLGPEIERLAPAVDFAPDAQASSLRERYSSLSEAYTTIAAIKLVLGFVAAFGLIKRRRRRGAAELD
jgi:hypothetical protein